MTYHTIETTSLTNEADTNLPKKEASHRKWLGAVAAALLLGVGTMLVSSSSSSNGNPAIRSAISLQTLEYNCPGPTEGSPSWHKPKNYESCSTFPTGAVCQYADETCICHRGSKGPSLVWMCKPRP